MTATDTNNNNNRAENSEAKRFKKIIKKMRKRFTENKYYEGQQMLKTLHARLTIQKKFHQACELLSEGALILMKHNKFTEGVEIINDLIETWKLMSYPENTFTDKRAQFLHKLLSMMVSNQESESLHKMMKYITKWILILIETNSISGSDLIAIDDNMQCLYLTYGMYLMSVHEYNRSTAALVRTNAVSTMVDLFAEWSQKSSSKERPYFITRLVLQYLFVGNVRSARIFIDSRDELRGPTVRHPLENFSDLLVECMERKSVVLYNVVSKEYMHLLKVDPKLFDLMLRVANRCLGIPLPKGSGGILGSIMSLLS